MKTLTKPKTASKAKKKTVKTVRKEATSISLDPAVHAQSKKFAEAEKRSFSQYVELALEHYNKEKQQAIQAQQAVAQYVQPGEVHGVWSAYDEFKAAEQMQALLESTKQ